MSLKSTGVYNDACTKYRHLSAQQLERVLESTIDDLTADPQWPMWRDTLKRAQILATNELPGYIQAGITEPRLIEAIALSDLLLDRTGPCREEASKRRQRGILRYATGAHAVYPYFLPVLRTAEVLGHLLDERAYLKVPVTTYTLTDHDGEEHKVEGPAPDCGDDLVSRDRFRAYHTAQYGGLSVLYGSSERITDCERGLCDGSRVTKSGKRCCDGRRRITRLTAWPFPTRLPGCRGSGARLAVSMREFLTALKFGTRPPQEDAISKELDTDAPPQLAPAMPSTRSLIGAPRPRLLKGGKK